MSPTLSIFFIKSKEKNRVTVAMEGRQDSVSIVSDQGQNFARSLFPSAVEMDIQLTTNGAMSVHTGLCVPINAKLAKAVMARSEDAATLLHQAVDFSVCDEDGKGLFGSACTEAFDLVNDIVTIRKLLRGYVLGPKRARKSVLAYLPDPIR
jgi:hypothetical protein